MSQTYFIEKLKAAIDQNNSLLCIGLDPDPIKYPASFADTITADTLTDWGVNIIEQTADVVCCYKPNFAFYEQFGPEGLQALQRTIAAVPDPIPVLLDAKRGDIGSTAVAYARAAFEAWQADAITVNPYLGQDSIAPFIAYPGKMAFVLCYTSNNSAKTIQEFGTDTRLFEHIAQQGQTWGDLSQIGFVVGATQSAALIKFRELAPDSWILAPGVGAQGGDLNETVRAGLNAEKRGLIVPVSRGVLYAASPREAAVELRDQINVARNNN